MPNRLVSWDFFHTAVSRVYTELVLPFITHTYIPIELRACAAALRR